MSKLFDENWQWTSNGSYSTIAIGKQIRSIARILEKQGYDRAEILCVFVTECQEELLKIANEKEENTLHSVNKSEQFLSLLAKHVIEEQ